MANTESDVTDIPQDQLSDTFLGGYAAEDFYVEEEEELEPVEVVLRSEDFISGPFKSRDCTLPTNILEFDFSFGYDCKKYYNMVVADPETIMFISGNLIHFFNVPTRSLTFRRSAFGGGLGHMTKNPNVEFQHIAIAENGDQPPIIVYQWPTLDIVCLLREGTAKCYNHLNYSPNGDLLVSQGGEPDHLITVWNWPKSRILLRTKSYVSDVYRVFFSPYCPGQLSTCGMSHIKFWKMARTFTGLKLQGELGRFGKTEYSDILGIYPMPDEKVISGCSWGNILIWEAGLIKIEVFRKLRKKCHEGPIVQFDFKEGELWTVSMDGSVKVWHYDTIDQADPPDDDRIVQLEPIFDFRTPNAQFMCIARRSNEAEDTFYYAQDGNGGLWLIDLTTELNVTPSQQLYVCHAGAVADIAACPYETYLVSLGMDGRLHLYEYTSKELLFVQQFPAKGVCMIWLPITVDPTGDVLILGFDDGCLRVIVLTIKQNLSEYRTTTIQCTKPHNKPLLCMSLNKTEDILVTAGEDKTIFVFKVQSYVQQKYVELLPIGYVPTTEIVTYMAFHNSEPHTIILGCKYGFIDIISLPNEPQAYTTITYILSVKPITQRFVTYKSQIRRDIKLREIAARKAKKREKKKKELDAYRKENPGLEIDEEIFLADSESEEQLEPLFIPEVPNNVLWVQHTTDNTLWISMAGFDAGYIYEYRLGQTDPVPYRFKKIKDADDIEINNFIYNYNKTYLIFAMQNGEIRINKVKPDFRNLSDYWQLSMHDNYNGYVPKMCFSYDEHYFFTSGHDGNVFSYRYYPEDDDYCNSDTAKNRRIKTCELENIQEPNTYTSLSLEEAIVKAEEDRKTKLANDHKKEYLESIHKLKKEFQFLLKKNQKLLPTQKIPRESFELDYRITKHLNDKMEENLALVRRKLAYELEKSEIRMKKMKKHFIDPLDMFPICVEAIRMPIKVSTLRQKKLPDGFAEMQKYVEEKLIEAELKGRPPERQQVVVEAPPPPPEKKKELEYFLLGLSAYTIEHELDAKIVRLLKKYRMRKIKLERRQQEWEKFNQTKPVEGVNHPDDEAAYAIAVQTIGDYKLKSAHNYKVPVHLRENKMKKYKILLAARERQFDLRHDFNHRVHDLREKKVKLHNYLVEMHDLLADIHKEIPPEFRCNGPDVFEMKSSDFPEKNLELTLDLPPDMRKQKAKVIPVISEPNEDLLEKEILPCVQHGVALEEGETISPWENELKQIRVKRKIFQQKLTIMKMDRAIVKFDRFVEDTYNDHLYVSVDAKFLDLHILTLNQELMILKEFEFGENKLSDEIRTLQEDVLDLQDVLNDHNSKIDNYKREIERSEDQVKVLQRKFQDAAGDNKFFDFLRRIFKKKYKPPKAKTDDEDSDSESSSSSSSEDDDEEGSSIDSRDVGPIRLDESVCPKGCDQALYDLTFTLRNERHGVEQIIKDRQAAIESIKKDIEHVNKKFRATEANLNTVQEELEAYQREKQQKLNQIVCTVILKLDQLQHLIGDNKLANVRNTLVFSKQVLGRLYRRVGQLQSETDYQKQKHKKDIQHLARMGTDCKFMEKTILRHYEEVNRLMKRKFGKLVNIDEITEACLKRTVFEMRMSMLDIRSLYEKEMVHWRNKFAAKQTELAKVIQENTTKMELLASLNTEKTELMKILKGQDEKRAHFFALSEAKLDVKADILKLTQIVKGQQKELKALRDEILTLKTKGLQQRPPIIPSEEVEEEEEELPLMELDESDDIIRIEGYNWRYVMDQEHPTHHYNILVYPQEARFTAREMLRDLFNELDLEAPDREVAEDIISHLLKQVSVTSILNELLAFIPRKLEENEQEILEIIAEKLYVLKSPEEESIEEENEEIIARAALDAIVSRTFSLMDAAQDIANMLKDLVEEVPLPYILEESSILRIMNKIINDTVSVEKDELIKQCITSVTPGQRAAMEQILQVILDQVYGVGMDYLYYIDI